MKKYYKPIIVSFLIFLAGVYLYLNPDLNPFRIFVRFWCFLQAFSVAINLKEQFRFYEWWSKSGLSDSHRRGFGTNGYPFLGFIKMPTLTPKWQKIMSFGYLATLLLSVLFPTAIFISLSFVFALFYFSSLWAERNCSYHRDYLSLAVLFYLSLSPNLYGFSESGTITLYCIMLHVSSIYTAGALQKIGCSFFYRKSWFSYSPHTFLWFAMWSKPYYKKIQKFAFLNPQIIAIGGFIVLIAEAALIFLLGTQFEIQVILAVTLLVFHTLVFVIQGIDYITFWSPVLILFFIPFQVPELTFSYLLLPSYLFCAGQLIYAFAFLEDFNVNIPPFTCCPMFVNVCQVKEHSTRYYVMWDLDSPIPFERLEWMYPFVKEEFGMALVEKDISKLPVPFVGFGYYKNPTNMPRLQSKWFHSDLVKDEGFFIFSNVSYSPELENSLKSLAEWLHSDTPSPSQYDKSFLEEAYQRYENCYALFRNALN